MPSSTMANVAFPTQGRDDPPSKFDIKVMLKAGDAATASAAARLALPPRFDGIMVPPGHPRTKPRALNAALEAARGALVMVYDAEDRPTPASSAAPRSALPFRPRPRMPPDPADGRPPWRDPADAPVHAPPCGSPPAMPDPATPGPARVGDGARGGEGSAAQAAPAHGCRAAAGENFVPSPRF